MKKNLCENNYCPPGKIIWDTWFLKTNKVCHAFYLQSKNKDAYQEFKLAHISIGHAISSDGLKNWKELAPALLPSWRDTWDNLSLWSGSVIEKGGLNYLFYTGRSKNSGRRWVRKIGLATSQDLMSWRRHEGNPILEVDGRYYDVNNRRNALGNTGSWRDPFVFEHPTNGKYYMTITARTNKSRAIYNGCVGIAESEDLIHWNVLPPIFAPGLYDEIEMTQIVFYDNKFYLFFSTHDRDYEPVFARKTGAVTGLHCYVADDLFGEYKPVNGNGIVYSDGHAIYSMRILKDGNGFIGIGWNYKNKKGKFVGGLTNTVKVTIKGYKITIK
ncbi:MAG TPA: hypothetical protein ENI66_02210 [Candidatus Yonathbacteria bacterium]|nr:hypothetical protein [Candidatus Yonathbacteria bacterium]